MGWMVEQFELSRGGSAQNVRPMEGLRGVAVLLVFFVHYVTLIGPWITPGTALASWTVLIHAVGNAGVDLFFVLSGYLIYGSLIARRQSLMHFLRRRVARIYPAFCVVFAVYIVLSLLHQGESKIPKGAYDAWIYLLQNFLLLPGLFPIEPLVTVAWSLSYEMFYYLAIPLLILALNLRARSTAWRILFFLATAIAILAYCALYGGHIRLVMFIAGILLHETLRGKRIAAPGSGVALAMFLAGLLGMALPVFGPGALVAKMTILACALFMTCYSCFCRPQAALARGFSWTPLRWLGNMSYSYYLVHGLTLKVAFIALAALMPAVRFESLFFLAMIAPMLALTLVPSAALFILVERPFSLAPTPRTAPVAGAAAS